MSERELKIKRRMRRKKGLAVRIRGTAQRPRLTVFRSNKHIYAQIVDDAAGVTLCAASTQGKDLREKIKNGGNIEAAKAVGAALAQQALAKEIRAVCLDRNGYRYHGRLKGLADAAREAGLQF